MGKSIEVKVPDIGDYKDVPVIEVLVKDGERVEKDQPLLVLESDKATLEVPAPAAGTVKGLKVKVGAKVSKGDAVCELEGEAATDTAPAPAPAKAAATKAQKSAASRPAVETEPLPPQAGSREPEPRPGASAAAGAPVPARDQPPDAPPAGSAKATPVQIPDLGDYHDVPIIEVLVQNGDQVAKDQPLLVLESDKATLEVPAPVAGIVRELKRKVGDRVSKGDPLCRLEEQPGLGTLDEGRGRKPAGDEAKLAIGPAVEDRAAKSAPSRPPTTETAAPPLATPSAGGAVYAGPATRKFARELGVDLSQVKASGPRGRIVVEDVQGFVKGRMASPAPGEPGGSGIPPIPPVDFTPFGETENRPLARIRKLAAAHLHRAWLNVPHVTQFDHADITELEAFRKSQSEESGAKLTLLPFVMKAVAAALKTFPEFNASLAPDGESLVLKRYCHIGFAADTEHGLVVPVVRDVWHKGIAQLGAECAELAGKARAGKLRPDDLKGGCFSISSLGGIGGAHFTPIVNAPEVAILGVSRAREQPVWNGREFAPRLLCPLSLSYDHRVIDGAAAARFIVHLGKLLADLRRLAL